MSGSPAAGQSLFIRLLAGVVAALFAVSAACIVPPLLSGRGGSVLPFLPLILAGVVPALLGVVGFLLLVGIGTGRELLMTAGLRRWAVRVFYPLVVLLGRILGIPRDRIGSSFVEVNNRLVKARPRPLAPQRLLLLMPHCLQRSSCDVRITGNVANCRRCGQCAIKELVEIAEGLGSRLCVATGGTLARRIITEERPEGIVAVACERDLISGIQDAYPLPVIGILNLRPRGPCRDTGVDIAKVREAVGFFLGSGT